MEFEFPFGWKFPELIRLGHLKQCLAALNSVYFCNVRHLIYNANIVLPLKVKSSNPIPLDILAPVADAHINLRVLEVTL